MGDGSVKNREKLPTSFMDGPTELNANYYPVLNEIVFY